MKAAPALLLVALAGMLLASAPAGAPASAPDAAPEAPAGAARPDTLAPAPGAAPDSTIARVPWRIGEYFQFSIEWSGINAGSALMQVQNWQWVGGRRAWRVVSKTESNDFVSKFYRVRDRAETAIDAESLYTLRFEKHLREGGYRHDSAARFDHEAGKAHYDNGQSYDVPRGVHDVLSSFYYVRTVPLPDGGGLTVPAHDNRKTYDLEVKVIRREKMEVPAGTFQCVVVEPILKSEGIFKSKGRILVWLTDDARRLPVKVTSKVPIGSISVALTDYRLAFQRKP